MSAFEQKVLQIVRQIPRGRVTTYGRIARAAGAPRGARMVGYILNRRKFDRSVPAHRVVNRRGELTGRWHFETPSLMQRLLENEGIPVDENRILDFKRYLWEPPMPEDL